MTEARIKFVNLKGFPAATDGDLADKIETEQFLAASNEIVDIIRSFGTLFTPVISDMSGNILKIRKSYEKDPVNYKYLEDLIVLNVNVDNFAANALLWLKRGLQLICTFFENIFNDKDNADVVKKHLQDAYDKTLKPYHGFIVQSTIKKIRKSYEKDPVNYKYLEDLIVLNVNVDNFAANALLWLKRGLQLICTFFENIFNDKDNADVVKKHLQDAYDKTLKPYHGFIVQSTIKIIYGWVPTRSQLIGIGSQHDENIKVLETFLPSMRSHLDRIDSLLKKYDLDDKSKV